MAISFDKRKLKIKIIGNDENKVDEVPKGQEKVSPSVEKRTVEKSVLKVNKTFKEKLKEITELSDKKLNLSDFTAYQYYYSDSRYQFYKVCGNSVLSGITLEKYLSMSKSTVVRRATGLSEAEEYRSRFILLCKFDNKEYIFIWSSILYEVFDTDIVDTIRNLLVEMRE